MPRTATRVRQDLSCTCAGVGAPSCTIPPEPLVIRRQATRNTPEVKVTFVLPDAAHPGPVSVVGDFNAWTPGAHLLRRRTNGTRSVAVTLPAGEQVRFRYLGHGGRWFDDHDADSVDESGSLLRT